MTKYEFRAPTDADIEHVTRHLREVDVEEIRAAYDWEPKRAVDHSIEVSRDTISGGFADGECMFLRGVASGTFLSRDGWVWMVATDGVYSHTKPFLRDSVRWINDVRWDYARLLNFVDARNTATLKWLKWLGFDIKPAQPYGPFQMPFHKIEMINIPETEECAQSQQP